MKAWRVPYLVEDGHAFLRRTYEHALVLSRRLLSCGHRLSQSAELSLHLSSFILGDQLLLRQGNKPTM